MPESFRQDLRTQLRRNARVSKATGFDPELSAMELGLCDDSTALARVGVTEGRSIVAVFIEKKEWSGCFSLFPPVG